MPKLTQAAVDKISPPKAGRAEHFDTLLPGFGLRIAKTGHKAWIIFYRIGGKQRRYTIASLAALPKVEDARTRAREILQDVHRGVDPAAVRAATPERAPYTVKMLVAEFIDRYAKPKNRSWHGTDRN